MEQNFKWSEVILKYTIQREFALQNQFICWTKRGIIFGDLEGTNQPPSYPIEYPPQDCVPVSLSYITQFLIAIMPQQLLKTNIIFSNQDRT